MMRSFIFIAFFGFLTSCALFETRSSEDIIYDEAVGELHDVGETLVAEVLGINKMMASIVYYSLDKDPSASAVQKSKKTIRKALGDQEIASVRDAHDWMSTATGERVTRQVQATVLIDVAGSKLKGAAGLGKFLM